MRCPTTPSPPSARRRSPRSPSTTRSTACRPPCCPAASTTARTCSPQAGVTETPTTFDELSDAVDKLKAAGIAPIALGAKDAWPAAHWFYFFALRECSQDVMAGLAKDPSFSDECFLRAGEDLADFAATEPFNEGFLTTSAQQGAGSSAGLVANHKAAMELMGAWDPGSDRLAHARRAAARRPRLVPLPRRRRRRRRAPAR